MVEIIQRNFFERLYLLNDRTNKVYVNNCQLLKQHQINGLRFLYMQFKKNRPGAIVNFPSHCGKTVTVALFLYAVRNLLEKPVLILCKSENEMFIWKEYLLKWTEFNNDDIIIESTKVLKGKKIFINKIDALASYQRHSWSIIIIKDDLINKEISQISDGQYKIWITSTDMKKDLNMMAFIYNWLYPKSKISVRDFITSGNNQKEMYQKSIYLDSFLEEFVIREENIKQFNKTLNSLTSDLITNHNSENKSNTSRKNKDDTRTKIKRSRRTIDDDDDIITITNERVANIKHIQSKNIVNNLNVYKLKVNELSNDNVILDNETNLDDSVKYSKSNANVFFIMDMASDNDTNMKMDLNGTEEMNFENSIDEIVKIENTAIPTEATELKDLDIKIDEKNKDAIENTDTKQGIIDNSTNISQSEQNERDEEVKEIVETTINEDNTGINETVIICHKDVDAKLSELEERTLKKFKGSFLDSIF